MVTRDQIVQWLYGVADLMEENREYLTQLDAAIGDADHGTNMDRGFKKVKAQLPSVEDQDIGAILKATAMALISSVGGASGPLYGTLFMRASLAIQGRPELDTADMVRFLQTALEGVLERGRAQPGDKTMVDALTPGVEAFKKGVEGGGGTVDALRQTLEAAEQGMADTIPMTARKGRASYLGERSVGHQDPGATSAYLMLKALYDAVS